MEIESHTASRTPPIEPRPPTAIATRLSRVDGKHGRLLIAGRDVEQLAELPFESVTAALLGLDNDDSRVLTQTFARARTRAAATLQPIDREAGSMDALRAACARLTLRNVSPVQQSIDVIAAVGVITARWLAARAGIQSPPPTAAPHAEDLLRMATGNSPTVSETAAFNRYLVTVCDHGLNASTYAARVVASTGSDLISAVTAAIGALKGPLHGGAPGPVLDMLDAVGRHDAAESWIAEELAQGRRIMGMGHRVYQVRDPRAAALESAVQQLGRTARNGTERRLALARAVEQAAERQLKERHPERQLKANVEFYTAILLEALTLPRTGFSAVFAAGRVAGWCAHVQEQRLTGRLIRPRARYIGPEGI